jgi:hypothetical protein
MMGWRYMAEFIGIGLPRKLNSNGGAKFVTGALTHPSRVETLAQSEICFAIPNGTAGWNCSDLNEMPKMRQAVVAQSSVLGDLKKGQNMPILANRRG